jgi:hypothetical protein
MTGQDATPAPHRGRDTAGQHALLAGASTTAVALLLAVTPTDRALAGWQPREPVRQLCGPTGHGQPAAEGGRQR